MIYCSVLGHLRRNGSSPLCQMLLVAVKNWQYDLTPEIRSKMTSTGTPSLCYELIGGNMILNQSAYNIRRLALLK